MRFLLLASFVIGCSAPAAEMACPPPPAPPPLALGFHIAQEPIEITVTSVYDGDTFDAGLERFRPDNLDTPELGDKAHCPLEQERGEAARDAAREILTGATRVVATPTDNRRDFYGRVLVRIDVDGRDFGELMQDRGLALPYRRRPGWNWCATPVAACEENSEACGRVRRRQS